MHIIRGSTAFAAFDYSLRGTAAEATQSIVLVYRYKKSVSQYSYIHCINHVPVRIIVMFVVFVNRKTPSCPRGSPSNRIVFAQNGGLSFRSAIMKYTRSGKAKLTRREKDERRKDVEDMQRKMQTIVIPTIIGVAIFVVAFILLKTQKPSHSYTI